MVPRLFTTAIWLATWAAQPSGWAVVQMNPRIFGAMIMVARRVSARGAVATAFFPEDFPVAMRGGAANVARAMQQWFYEDNGAQAGPVDETTLHQMIADG